MGCCCSKPVPCTDAELVHIWGVEGFVTDEGVVWAMLWIHASGMVRILLPLSKNI
jgi:hypothetical protein